MKKNKLTTASGRPYSEFENSMTVCNRGPVLLQDYLLHEDMAHFNRECIPERVVHAKGTGAFGTFTVTHDITPYTKAKIFSEIGKVTKMFARFSIVGGEKGGAEANDMKGIDLDQAQRDMVDAIARKDFPKWALKIQVMTDAQRYRLCANYEQIPVNQCPYAVANYQRDGLMQTGENGGASPNYRPNSFDDIVVDESYQEPSIHLDQITEESNVADWYDRNENDDDHFTQPGLLYRNAMNEQDRIHLVSNIVSSMKGIVGEKKKKFRTVSCVIFSEPIVN